MGVGEILLSGQWGSMRYIPDLEVLLPAIKLNRYLDINGPGRPILQECQHCCSASL